MPDTTFWLVEMFWKPFENLDRVNQYHAWRISWEMLTIPFKWRTFQRGKTGYKYVTWIDCKSKFDFSEADITRNLWRPHRVYDRTSRYKYSAHTTTNDSFLKAGLKRFTKDLPELLPYSTLRLVWHTLQTSFAQFSFLRQPHLTVFTSFRPAIPLLARSRFPRKVNNILIDGSWMSAAGILMKGRDEINNGQAAGATFSFSPRARFPFSLPLSSACHTGYLTASC